MSSACEITTFGGRSVPLGKELVLLREHTLLCDIRKPPVLYAVGEKVHDLKEKVVTIENFGVIVSENQRIRGAICRSRGGWLRFLPLIQLEKFEEEEEDGEDTDQESLDWS